MSIRAEVALLEVPRPDLKVLIAALELYICMQELWLRLQLTTPEERELATDRRAAANSLLEDSRELL